MGKQCAGLWTPFVVLHAAFLRYVGLQCNAVLLRSVNAEQGVRLLFAWPEPVALLARQHWLHNFCLLDMDISILRMLSNHWM